MDSSEAQAFTYHSTVNMLEQQHFLSRRQMISALANMLVTHLLVNNIFGNGVKLFNDNGRTLHVRKLIHHDTGLRIGTATVADNDNVLLPLGDDTHTLTMAQCRPGNINLAHVKVDLDFDSLVEDADQPCHVKIKFVVHFPQCVVHVMSSANVVVNHSMLTGTENICTMSHETFLQNVLSETL